MSQYTALNYDIDPIFHAANKPKAKIGIVLANLGTPDAPTTPALRRYLAEFLADPRVIEVPRVIWMLILHGIILRVRPKKSAALYKSVWTSEGSPLLAISKQQQVAIQEQLGNGFSVKLGMRYGNPSIHSALRELQLEGVRKIIVLPLYPQYAGPTTGSTFDAVAMELKTWRWVPELHFINNYCDEPLYVEALANSVREHIEQNGLPQKIIFSYHGMPKRYLTSGDPYFCLCQKTTRLVQERLGLDKNTCLTSFQSRFGREEWLKPYTDETLENLPKDGIKDIAIISPAFSADCLETLEELAVENRHAFIAAGGEKYAYIPALNDRADHIHALVELLKSKV
ncbi:ferrochelatase [Cellvibrio sp. BR]|jgi:ferrochelatase|uniref:ferrochelatase n=1 Tax=Cellvibrio sp. BR TaxID=1134474 RepID=UPI000260135F|nr:ferrochelatase [Cellvibrio sp. BR]EIK46173.1 ferrochelatase [Cellvibrio sp. BR]